MNIRNVLRAYSLLRQLTDDESALLETLRGATDAERELLVETLSPQKSTTKRAGKKSSSPQREYDHCLRCGTTKRDSSHKDTSSPDYHEFQSSKDIDFCARCKGASYVHPIHHDETLGGYHLFESSKKSSKSASKSPRASGLAATLKRSLAQQQRVTRDADDNNDPNEHCQKEFSGGFICNEPADANVHHLRGVTGYHEFDVGKSTAPRAGAKSSTNGGATNSTPSSEAEPENVSTVTGD